MDGQRLVSCESTTDFLWSLQISEGQYTGKTKDMTLINIAHQPGNKLQANKTLASLGVSMQKLQSFLLVF